MESLRPIVNDLLEACGINEVPVAVELIAEHLGAQVAYSRYKGELAGILVRSDNGPAVIGVNSMNHIHRQRFTIAHECGHLCLHKGKDVFIDRAFRVSTSQRADPEEIEANRFAVELLMPHDRFLEDIADLDIEDDGVPKELAGQYAVSVQTITYRIGTLLDAVI